MKFIDTHTHLYLEEFQPSPFDAVQRAIDAGVGLMVFPNVDLTTIVPMKQLQSNFPENVVMAMGLHPTEVNDNWRADLDVIEAELNSTTRYVAVGEVGIDLYWDKTFINQQKECLDVQLQWARDKNLPVIIHCRDGLHEIIDVMKSRRENLPLCVFHSFGGSVEDVALIREYGDFYFGINGIVTFKNSKLRDVLPAIGLNRILLETDSPYLAPVPHRGKRNESAYIVHIAAYIANVLGVSVDVVSEITTNNAKQFFAL